MFTGALATRAKLCKQPQVSIRSGMEKQAAVLEDYTAVRKEDALPCGVTGMDLETVILSERSRTGKDTSQMISLTGGLEGA